MLKCENTQRFRNIAQLVTDFFLFSHYRCNDNFKGSRCEHFQLLSMSPNAKEAGLIAAVVIVIILLLIVLAVVIYFVRK